MEWIIRVDFSNVRAHQHSAWACKRGMHHRLGRSPRTFLEPRMPALAGGHIAAKTCLYTMTPDHDFVIGRHPGLDNVTVACGFSGHGFKFVPVVGEILADLLVDGTARHDIGLFEPTRFFRPSG